MPLGRARIFAAKYTAPRRTLGEEEIPNMSPLFVGAIAVFIGVLLGYFLGKNSAQAETRLLADRTKSLEDEKAGLANDLRTIRETVTALTGELATATANVNAERSRFTQMKADIETAFGDLAARALSANNQSFLTLAKQELGGQTAAAVQTLAAKEQAIKGMLDQTGATLKNLDEQTRAMEAQRSGAYAKVETLITSMQTAIPASLDALKLETSQLISALRAPKTRGNWGELQLKRCVEYAGMVQYCSFSQQVSTRDEDDKILRPDMTILLPNGREIVVDCKTPLDAFLDATGASDAAAQSLRFMAHAQRVKAHVRDLSSKAYWKQFEKAPDFVICFLPSEALFSAALEADPSLIEFSAQNHVIMATPTTLIALLRAVEFGWQQSEITENAKTIHEVGCKIYDKLVVAQAHAEKLGNALKGSVDYYNRFIGTIEGKGGVFSLGRQLGSLAHSDDELAESAKLQLEVRDAESPEWTRPLFAIAASESESNGDRD
jgi:DNA recombination protein RmuC